MGTSLQGINLECILVIAHHNSFLSFSILAINSLSSSKDEKSLGYGLDYFLFLL